MQDVTLEMERRPQRDAVLALYGAVGWTAYTRDPEMLSTAIEGSSFVVTAWCDEDLVGLARTVSDDATICYLQDILVHPDWQRRGLGRRLVAACLARYTHCRQKVLLTDDRPEQTAFYESLGFTRLDRSTGARLHAFVQMPGL